MRRMVRRTGRVSLSIMAVATLLCLRALQGGAVDDGVGLCRTTDAPVWLAFACSFMTVDVWRAAGRPDYVAPDGSRWQPWYYGDLADRGNNLLYEGYPYRHRRDGLLEAMLKTGQLPDEYDPAYVPHFWSLFRYTPWSVYFEHQAGCGAHQITNPYDFAESSAMDQWFPRASLLGMGWGVLAKDAGDPTRGLGDAAMLKLTGLADLGDILGYAGGAKAGQGYGLRDEINAVLLGHAAYPDASGGKGSRPGGVFGYTAFVSLISRGIAADAKRHPCLALPDAPTTTPAADKGRERGVKPPRAPRPPPSR